MFKFLSTQPPNKAAEPMVKHRTEQEIIAEIHAAFDSAGEYLLVEALKVLKDNEIPEEDRLKAEKLRRLGFRQTEEVKKLNEKETRVLVSKQLADDILYYKYKYPFIKFLPKTELDRICNTFGFVHTNVWNYIGGVPNKNLNEIDNAQELDVFDYPYKGRPGDFKHKVTGQVRSFHFLSEPYSEVVNIMDRTVNSEDWVFIHTGHGSPAQVSPLQIAAPPSMFNHENLKQVDNQLVDKDPIVFRYVRGGIQVLGKWGLEASDPVLLNPINN